MPGTSAHLTIKDYTHLKHKCSLWHAWLPHSVWWFHPVSDRGERAEVIHHFAGLPPPTTTTGHDIPRRRNMHSKRLDHVISMGNDWSNSEIFTGYSCLLLYPHFFLQRLILHVVAFISLHYKKCAKNKTFSGGGNFVMQKFKFCFLIISLYR